MVFLWGYLDLHNGGLHRPAPVRSEDKKVLTTHHMHQTIDTNVAQLFVDDSESINVGNIRRNLFEHRFEILTPSISNNDNEEEVFSS